MDAGRSLAYRPMYLDPEPGPGPRPGPPPPPIKAFFFARGAKKSTVVFPGVPPMTPPFWGGRGGSPRPAG